MIRRIVLQNFMSHEFSEIVLAGSSLAPIPNIPNPNHVAATVENSTQGGLTVLVGDNNSGKSAIVSALQIVSQNASGDYMVRHGESKCQVTIETEDPDSGTVHEISWIRNKGKVRYVIDGREIDRLKGGVPGDLDELLRLAQVKTTRDEFDVHIGEQKRPIFLLGDRASDRAAFFASSSDTSKLIEMQQLHRSKTKIAKVERKRLLEQSRKLNARLSTLQTLDQIKRAMTRLDARAEQLEQQQKQLAEICRLLAQMEEVKTRQARYGLISNALKSLQPVPEFQPTERLIRLIEKTQQHLHNQLLAKKRQAILTNLSATPTIQPLDSMRSLIKKLERVSNSRRMWQRRFRVLESMTAPPATSSDERQRLNHTIASIQKAQESLDRSKRKLARCSIGLEETQQAISEQVQELENCPTCGQPIESQELMDRMPMAQFARWIKREHCPNQPDLRSDLAQPQPVSGPPKKPAKGQGKGGKKPSKSKRKNPPKDNRIPSTQSDSDLSEQQKWLFPFESAKEGGIP